MKAHHRNTLKPENSGSKLGILRKNHKINTIIQHNNVCLIRLDAIEKSIFDIVIQQNNSEWTQKGDFGHWAWILACYILCRYVAVTIE